MFKYLISRFVTLGEIIEGLKNPVIPNNNPGAVLFNARYRAGKAIEGVDFE